MYRPATCCCSRHKQPHVDLRLPIIADRTSHIARFANEPALLTVLDVVQTSTVKTSTAFYRWRSPPAEHLWRARATRMINFVKSAQYSSLDPFTHQHQTWEALAFTTTLEIEDQLLRASKHIPAGAASPHCHLQTFRRDIQFILAMGYMRLSYLPQRAINDLAHRKILSGTRMQASLRRGFDSPHSLAMNAAEILGCMFLHLQTPMVVTGSIIPSERAVEIYYLCVLAECHVRLGASEIGKAWGCLFSALRALNGEGKEGREMTKETMWRARAELRKEIEEHEWAWCRSQRVDYGMVRAEWFTRVITRGTLAKMVYEKLGEEGGLFKHLALVDVRVWIEKFRGDGW